MRLAYDVLHQPALARYVDRDLEPAADPGTDDGWRAFIQEQAETLYHPVGTARMGPSDDPTSVVDGELRVLGVEGLRVADASVMPTITRGHTQAPTMLIGERAAALIRAVLMERLSGLDASFLYNETPSLHMHTLKYAVLDVRSVEAGFSLERLRSELGDRLHLLPQFRRRVVEVPLGLHHPVWVEDIGFRLEDHVRSVAVPAPGGRREMDEVIGRLASTPLDRSRPLWECWVLEGLADRPRRPRGRAGRRQPRRVPREDAPRPGRRGGGGRAARQRDGPRSRRRAAAARAPLAARPRALPLGAGQGGPRATASPGSGAFPRWSRGRRGASGRSCVGAATPRCPHRCRSSTHRGRTSTAR